MRKLKNRKRMTRGGAEDWGAEGGCKYRIHRLFALSFAFANYSCFSLHANILNIFTVNWGKILTLMD